jgi:hypothetical protein
MYFSCFYVVASYAYLIRAVLDDADYMLPAIMSQSIPVGG